MSFKQKLSKLSRIPPQKLPSSYQIIGDIMLLKLPKIKSQTQKRDIAEIIKKMLPNVKTICEIEEVQGEFREPSIEILSGSETKTIHKENDILYKIDVSQIMFSKGNLSERKRLISQVKEGEIIVDMFAGIGYFSLGIAKFTKAKEIIAIEKNATSYRFLTDNVQLNKLMNVNAINGDCMLAAVSFKNHADRVIMGYFPETEKFLPPALYMVKNGGIIHYHNIYKENDFWKKPLSEIKEACEHYKIRFDVLAKKKVKSYAPRVFHTVIDFQVFKE